MTRVCPAQRGAEPKLIYVFGERSNEDECNPVWIAGFRFDRAIRLRQRCCTCSCKAGREKDLANCPDHPTSSRRDIRGEANQRQQPGFRKAKRPEHDMRRLCHLGPG